MSWFRFQRIGSESGYTLIELLAVMAVLMFLSLFTLPIVEYLSNKARLTASLQDLRVIEQALESYQVAKGHYPDRLGDLVDDGYIKRGFTFESPWSTSDKRKYYFYAVDAPGQAHAFILGDPALQPPDSCKQQDQSAVLYKGKGHPLPCGMHPTNKAAFLFSHLTFPDGEPASYPDTLSGYRESCDPTREKDISTAAACVVKTES